MPRLNKNPHFLKSLTSKAEDFVGFLFESGEARLSPCKNESDKSAEIYAFAAGWDYSLYPKIKR